MTNTGDGERDNGIYNCCDNNENESLYSCLLDNKANESTKIRHFTNFQDQTLNIAT